MANNVKLNSSYAFYKIEEAKDLLGDAFVEVSVKDESIYKKIADAMAKLMVAQDAILKNLQEDHDKQA